MAARPIDPALPRVVSLAHLEIGMTATQRARPEWFASFLADRGTQNVQRTPWAAYCRDFDAIAEIIVGNRSNGAAPVPTSTATPCGQRSRCSPPPMRRFGSAVLVDLNTLCTDLYDDELIPANPMGSVGRPRSDETLSKALPPNVIDALLDTLMPIRYATPPAGRLPNATGRCC